jgi:hypothetical protein
LKSGDNPSKEFTNQFGVEDKENLKSDSQKSQAQYKDEKELNESPHPVEITIKV